MSGTGWEVGPAVVGGGADDVEGASVLVVDGSGLDVGAEVVSEVDDDGAVVAGTDVVDTEGAGRASAT